MFDSTCVEECKGGGDGRGEQGGHTHLSLIPLEAVTVMNNNLTLRQNYKIR